jgi:hypothetical protein
MQTAIGIAFLMGGAFYIAFGVTSSFAFALLFLAVAHMGGSILWVFSTVLLQTQCRRQVSRPGICGRSSIDDTDDGGVELYRC